uniref:Uncharacterized protein n=1 Tax=Anguilla anguilla TaxID=7936 RepID=A0A0E9WS51_ANGAN
MLPLNRLQDQVTVRVSGDDDLAGVAVLVGKARKAVLSCKSVVALYNGLSRTERCFYNKGKI